MAKDLGVSVKISADGSQAIAETAAVRAGVAGIGDGAEAGQRRVEGFVDAFTPLGKVALGINELAELMGRIAGPAADLAATADAYNNMAGRLRLAVGDGEALARALESVRAVANDTGADLDATATLYARLAQAGRELGLSQAALVGLTETINQSFAVSGASAAEASGAIRQLAQGLAAGALRGDEFNSVMENSPRLAQALADGLGVGIGELRAMAEQGKLTAEVVTTALRGQADAIAADFSRMPDTVGRATQRLKNEWMVFVGELDKTSGATATVASALNGLAGNLDTIASLATVAGQAVLAGLAVQAGGALLSFANGLTAATALTGKLSAAIKSLPVSVVVGVSVAGLALAVEGAQAIGEAFAKASPEVRAAEASIKAIRDGMAAQAGQAAAAAQSLSDFAKVAARSAEDVARLPAAEREAYAARLEKARPRAFLISSPNPVGRPGFDPVAYLASRICLRLHHVLTHGARNLDVNARKGARSG